MDRKRHGSTLNQCHQFLRFGRCKFGAKCKFLHDDSSSSSASAASTASPVPLEAPTRRNHRQETRGPVQDRLREWKKLLDQPPSSSRTTYSSIPANQKACGRFFTLALELIGGDIGASQETVKLMAQDPGLAFIKNLVDQQIPLAANDLAKSHLWKDQIQPLFQILTHPSVIDSNVLEQQVAVICNFIQGIGGRRMGLLYDFILDLLYSWSRLSMAKDDKCGISACELSLSVLATMIDCNTSNIVNDNFARVVKSFDIPIQAASRSDNEFSKLQARKHLQYLQQRLGVGSAFSEAKAAKKTPVTRAEFIMRKDLPGQLSADGPRHDNDHADIRNIRILPTQEEITSVRNEYLPTTDTSSFHLPGIRGRLDREFRLLREDTVGQLRDAVSAQLKAMSEPKYKQDRSNGNAIRTYAYGQASIVGVDFDRNRGMDLLVQFLQPMTKQTVQQRRDWWGNSKRLQPGGLVCMLSGKGSVLFCVVGDSTITANDQKSTRKVEEDEEPAEKLSLADDDRWAYAHLHLVEARPNDIGQALQWYQNIGIEHQLGLVEFPRVLLPSFQHTLIALQRMSKKSNVPFDELIAPVKAELDLGVKDVGPPTYTTKVNFSFDLTCLTKDSTTLRHSPQKPLEPQQLASHSLLDATQSSALLNTLSRKLALIQGPPGTGKSFTGEKIIKVLLANKRQADLGPILCVCYTNHALDQLLVHLKKDKVKIIRIGSRSKSEELEGLNLRVVAQAADRTKAEKGRLWDLRSERNDHVDAITRLVNELATCQTPVSIRKHLSIHHNSHHNALFGIEDEEGWQQQQRRKPGYLFNKWRNSGSLEGHPPRDITQLIYADVWAMSLSERKRLYNHWLREIRDPLITEIINKYKSYENTTEELEKVSRDVDLRCLHASDVVGVTTTGLAKNLHLLQKLRCKVMLCEEAGEVLEAHTLTAFLPSVEQAILIGDHQQLRPQIANYELQSTNPRGAQYSLDVSLFERLIQPPYDTDSRLPYDTLETQRRMHPSVSELIRSTLYPRLEDDGKVAGYPEIYGMKKRLFWMHHESPEDREVQLDPTTTSHTNTFEVEMTIALVQHLVRQGFYGSDDIAVITPYLGQLSRLRREMSRLFEISVGERDIEELEALDSDQLTAENITSQPHKPTATKRTLLKSIRLATVDNFQGEEAKVVVISLVRSNAANKCGFLSTSNRINVLLSRAQHGMYLIGNANTYRHVHMWAKVLEILDANGNLGTQLELHCPRHPNPNTPLLVSKADDFLRVAPEGGCILQCDKRLTCGHSCINRCHHENLHNAVKCLEPCPRPNKGCQHPCRLVCGEPCKPKCDERLQGINITLACGHRISTALCWEAQDPSSIVCKQKVSKVVPGCGHTVEVPCHTDVSVDTYKCRKSCLDPRPCGHNCQSSCHECKQRKDGKIVSTVHPFCKQACGRAYTTCRHTCRQPCHGEAKCPPCPTSCEVRCSHSKCSKKCHEPCVPCAEQTCASKCPHSRCTMPCAAPCDWVPCSRRCEEVLSCGHQCPSICGETCPSAKFCQTCCSEEIKSVEVDFIMGMQYHEIDLNEDPCIFPDCGHFVTKTNMDGIMDMKAHYEISAEDNPTAILNTSQPFSMDEVKVCPNCRGSLRNISRYGRIVRRAMLDEATKKFVTWSQAEYSKLAELLLDIQGHIAEALPPPRTIQKDNRSKRKILPAGRAIPIHRISEWVGGSRYDEALKLWQRISTFLGQVRREEQPFQRVNDFVQHATRLRKIQGVFAFDEARIQSKGYLQACTLSLKCDIIIVTDFMVQQKSLLESRPKLNLDFAQHMKECETLAERAYVTGHPRQESEAHVYFARFCAFSRALASTEKTEDDPNSNAANAEKLKEQGKEHLVAAREIVTKYSAQTKGLMAEIEAAEKMLRDSVFYDPVSTDELREVYRAMAAEFSGTGHWYLCANGHPFTIGECGMPMQRALCPECGASVGGANHVTDAGVQRADDIENLTRGLGGMGIN
ncbi:hypothetical protein F4811DRAFT_560463 [Daldinia bambusicola]|nr:hypothetical protein F4811DRAFT_560463 [Daldinia bambusicola]